MSPNRNEVENLFNAQGGICYYCHREMSIGTERQKGNAATLDHKTPRSRGGTEERSNLCACCFSCNNAKSDLTEEEYQNYKNKEPLTIQYHPYRGARRTILFRKQSGRCRKCNCIMVKTTRIIENTAMVLLHNRNGPDVYSNSYLVCFRCYSDANKHTTRIASSYT